MFSVFVCLFVFYLKYILQHFFQCISAVLYSYLSGFQFPLYIIWLHFYIGLHWISNISIYNNVYSLNYICIFILYLFFLWAFYTELARSVFCCCCCHCLLLEVGVPWFCCSLSSSLYYSLQMIFLFSHITLSSLPYSISSQDHCNRSLGAEFRLRRFSPFCMRNFHLFPFEFIFFFVHFLFFQEWQDRKVSDHWSQGWRKFLPCERNEDFQTCLMVKLGGNIIIFLLFFSF